MKAEKITSCLITAAVAFCMSFGGAVCVATGLELKAHIPLLALGCLLAALIPAVAYSIPKGGRVLMAGSALALVFLLTDQNFMHQLMDICRQAVTLYSQAYSFPVPEVLQQARANSHLLPLLVVAGVVSVVAAWIMLHRFPAALAVFTAVLPLVSCFVVTDTVPQVWCLVLWLFGIAMLMLTQAVRVRNPHTANRLTGMLAAPLLLVLTLLAMVVPEKDFQPPLSQKRVDYALNWLVGRIPFIGQTSDGQLVLNFGGDLESEVALSELDDWDSSESVVCEITPDWSGKIYLRIRDYDVYTGTEWESSSRTESLSPPPYLLTDSMRNIDIRILGNRSQMLVPYYADQILTLEDGNVLHDRSQREYSFTVVPLGTDWKTQWRYGARDYSIPTPSKDYLELPVQTSEAAGQILSQIGDLSGMDTVSSAEAIAGYVRNVARYSHKVDTMPDDRDDFAIWFLEEADRGYCVHFATATTVLLRANGIPARYVEGYTCNAKAGRVNPVQQNKAHAWVEYFVEGAGWVMLDATPGQEERPTVEPTKPTESTNSPSTEHTEPSQKPSIPVEQPTEGTKPSTAPKPTVTPGPAGTGTDTGGGTTVPSEAPDFTMPRWLVRILLGLAIGAGALAVIVGQWALRRYRKLRRLAGGTPNDRVVARYREACRIGKAVKVPVPETLSALANKAKFSPHTLTREELAAANTAFANHFALLDEGRWYQKLLWRFLFALY